MRLFKTSSIGCVIGILVWVILLSSPSFCCANDDNDNINDNQRCTNEDVTDAAAMTSASNVSPDDIRDFLQHARELREEAYYSKTKNRLSERTILSALLKRVGMDPNVIDERPIRTNWFEELHTKTLALAPSAFWKVYLTPPNRKEFDTIVALDVEAQEAAESLEDLQAFAFRRHRDRGMAPSLSVAFSTTVLQPIQHYIGYATPSNTVLAGLAKYGPIVEVGAGNAYWGAALSQLYGVDVVSYDVEPVATDNQNLFSFATSSYTNVQKSACVPLFDKDQRLDGNFVSSSSPIHAKDRALLTIFPNCADEIDNPTQHIPDQPPIWDVECLLAYMKAGGSTVIYVGERESQTSVQEDHPPDSGVSSSRDFQQLLLNNYDLIEQFDTLTWWDSTDVTVWRRKS